MFLLTDRWVKEVEERNGQVKQANTAVQRSERDQGKLSALVLF